MIYYDIYIYYYTSIIYIEVYIYMWDKEQHNPANHESTVMCHLSNNHQSTQLQS